MPSQRPEQIYKIHYAHFFDFNKLRLFFHNDQNMHTGIGNWNLLQSLIFTLRNETFSMAEINLFNISGSI